MTDIELLTQRLAFRFNKRTNRNNGMLSDIHRILQQELNITSEEFAVFNTRFLLLDSGKSYEEIIRISLDVSARTRSYSFEIWFRLGLTAWLRHECPQSRHLKVHV